MPYQAKRQVCGTTWPCRPKQGRPEVRGIAVERLEGINLVCAPQPGADCLGQRKVVLGVPAPAFGFLREQCEPIPHKFADRLEQGHPFPPCVVGVASQQAVTRERRQQDFCGRFVRCG